MIGNALSIAVCASCFLYTCYALCNLTYFLSNHNINQKVDDTAGSDGASVWWALLLDMSHLSIFVIQHSVMAIERVKDFLCRLRVEYMNRSLYNTGSALCLLLLISNWQFIPTVTLWKVDTETSDSYWYLFTGLHVLAWSIIYSGCLMVDISELAGLKQVYYKMQYLPQPMETKSRELSRYYSHMRHPSFVGFLVILWFHPFMTIDRLLLASTLTLYMALMWTIDQKDYNYHAVLVRRKKMELS